MKSPRFVRDLTDAERAALRGGLRPPESFTLRRPQVLPASADGQRPARIGTALGCATRTVRGAIRAFHAGAVGCPTPRSKAPNTTHPVWPRGRDEELRALPHQSPRTLGRPTSLWTLDVVAGVCHEKGRTRRVLSPETIRQVLFRLGGGWKRAKHGVTSPDPGYAKKKSGAGPPGRAGRPEPRSGPRVPERVLVDAVRQSDPFAWAADPVRREGNARDPEGGGPEAVACHGVLRHDTGGMMLRFRDGRPVRATTEDFLGRVCETLAGEGKKGFVLAWDDAALHFSKRVRAWIARHNRRVRRTKAGCRTWVCGLSVKAPWRNPIEPKGMHGKRAVVEPNRKLTADELRHRVADYYRCELHPPLLKPQP